MTETSELFLSRVILNPRNREVQRDLANCHLLHQRVMAAFPTATTPAARAEFGVLYRPDVDPRTGVVTLLVQSWVAPNWSHLLAARGDRSYLLETPGLENPATKAIGEVLSGLREGQRLRFRLRANPTKRLAERRQTQRVDRLLGKRVALLKEEDQEEWLQRRAAAAGFRVVRAEARPDRVFGQNQTGMRAGEPGGRLTFGAVVFEGLLEISDAESFRRAVRCGIGSGKAYGFGLLSLAPI